MSLLDLALLGLACWRVARMLALEAGPGDMFRRLRLALGAWETIDGMWMGKSIPAKLVVCPLCSSVWLAALFLLIYPFATWLVIILAISGLASALHLALSATSTGR